MGIKIALLSSLKSRCRFRSLLRKTQTPQWHGKTPWDDIRKHVTSYSLIMTHDSSIAVRVFTRWSEWADETESPGMSTRQAFLITAAFLRFTVLQYLSESFYWNLGVKSFLGNADLSGVSPKRVTRAEAPNGRSIAVNRVGKGIDSVV